MPALSGSRWERHRVRGVAWRYYLVDFEDAIRGFVERDPRNPSLWSVVLYAPSWGTLANSLKEGKELLSNQFAATRAMPKRGAAK